VQGDVKVAEHLEGAGEGDFASVAGVAHHRNLGRWHREPQGFSAFVGEVDDVVSDPLFIRHQAGSEVVELLFKGGGREGPSQHHVRNGLLVG
jgi:hypothetical protein